jgi:hypothetical protein
MGSLFGDDDAPAAPAAPDPWETAQAQYQYNSRAARDSAMLNAIDQYGPYGATTFARRPDGTPYAQAVTLAPEVQAMLDAQFGAGTALNQAAQRQLGFLPQDRFQLPQSPDARQYATDAFGERALDSDRFADPLSGNLYQASEVGLQSAPSTQDIANTFYQQGKSRIQGDIDSARKNKEIELARRGIPIGSEIYRDEMNRLDTQQNNAYSDISRQAELAAGQEQSRQFGQNLSAAQYGGQEQQRLQGADLSNRGFLGQTQNQQFNQLLSAMGYGQNQYQTNLGNQLLERQQPLAEYGALMGASPQFQSPSFMNTAALNVQSPDYTGVVNNNYAQQSANYRQQAANSAAGNNSMWGAIGQIGGAAASIFSDKEMKEDRSEADGEDIIAMIRDMPIDNYRYTDEARENYDLPERRTGPMAQDYARAFEEGSDGKVIDLGDAVGKLMAAMKALDKRTMDMKEAA